MTDLVLFHFPNACSQVTLFALETTGVDYEVRLVNVFKNEQESAAYTEVSPLGKVPILLIDGVPLSENVALLTYIAESYPDVALFPGDRSPLGLARRISGLSFCGSTLHPIVRGILAPSRLTDGDGEGVRRRSIALANKSFGYAEKVLNQSGWWLGTMSVIDVYLNWAFSIARRGGFDSSAFPHLNALPKRLMEYPSYARMMTKEGEYVAALGLTPKN